MQAVHLIKGKKHPNRTFLYALFYEHNTVLQIGYI